MFCSLVESCYALPPCFRTLCEKLPHFEVLFDPLRKPHSSHCCLLSVHQPLQHHQTPCTLCDSETFLPQPWVEEHSSKGPHRRLVISSNRVFNLPEALVCDLKQHLVTPFLPVYVLTSGVHCETASCVSQQLQC